MFMLSAVRGVGLGSAPVAQSAPGGGLQATGFVSYDADDMKTAPAHWPFISHDEQDAHSSGGRRRRLAGPGRPRLGQAVAAASQVQPCGPSCARWSSNEPFVLILCWMHA